MDLPQSRIADAFFSILRPFLWYNQPVIQDFSPSPQTASANPPVGRLRATISSVKAMSIWLRRKDEDGKTHLYAILFAPFVVVAFIGILFVLLLPLVQAVRAWLSV